MPFASPCPESTRSLPNADLQTCYIDLVVKALADFLGGSGLEEEIDGLSKIRTGFFNGRSLAGDVQLGAERHVAVPFALHDRGDLPAHDSHSLEDLWTEEMSAAVRDSTFSEFDVHAVAASNPHFPMGGALVLLEGHALGATAVAPQPMSWPVTNRKRGRDGARPSTD